MGFWDRFRKQPADHGGVSLEELLANAEGMNSLEVKSLVDPITSAALARADGPQMVISWWQEGAPAGRENYSRAVVAANIQHQLVDKRATMYAALEFDALATLPTEVVSWAFCSCPDCKQKLLPERARVASERLLELSGEARDQAIRALQQAQVEPDAEQLQAFFAQGDSHAGTEWMREHPSVARDVAIHLLENRTNVSAALTLLEDAGDAVSRQKLTDAFLDPQVSEELPRLALLLRPSTGWDVAGFDDLPRAELEAALERFGNVARWPRWAPGAELPDVTAVEGEAHPKLRELLVGLARDLDPRKANLLRAAARHYDTSQLAAFAAAFHERWVAAGLKKSGEHALTLVTLYGSPSQFRRTVVGLGGVKRAQMVRLLDSLAVAPRGIDWVNYWREERSEPSVEKRADAILRDEAAAHGMSVAEFYATLDRHVADAALEAGGATPREYRDILERAFDNERVWSGENFGAWYVGQPDSATCAQALVFDVDGTRCSFVEAELLDIDDDPVSVFAEAHVKLVHPAEMSPGAVTAWTTRFAEYEMAQPFPQLEAVVYDERAIDRMLEEVDSNMGRFVKILSRAGFRWDEAGDVMVIEDAATERRFTLEYYSDGYDPSEPIHIEVWGFDDGPGELRPRFVSRVARALSAACR